MDANEETNMDVSEEKKNTEQTKENETNKTKTTQVNEANEATNITTTLTTNEANTNIASQEHITNETLGTTGNPTPTPKPLSSPDLQIDFSDNIESLSNNEQNESPPREKRTRKAKNKRETTPTPPEKKKRPSKTQDNQLMAALAQKEQDLEEAQNGICSLNLELQNQLKKASKLSAETKLKDKTIESLKQELETCKNENIKLKEMVNTLKGQLAEMTEPNILLIADSNGKKILLEIRKTNPKLKIDLMTIFTVKDFKNDLQQK